MTNNQEMILSLLKQQLPNAHITETLFRNERTLTVDNDQLYDVLLLLKDFHGYQVLIDLTGVDYLQPEPHTKVVYWLHHPTTYDRIRVVTLISRDGQLPSATPIWAGADWYERELYDLFGVIFIGHPKLERILMPDDWKGHPLRRDYALTEEPVEFKHGVKPKIPSEIIHLRDHQKLGTMNG